RAGGRPGAGVGGGGRRRGGDGGGAPGEPSLRIGRRAGQHGSGGGQRAGAAALAAAEGAGAGAGGEPVQRRDQPSAVPDRGLVRGRKPGRPGYARRCAAARGRAVRGPGRGRRGGGMRARGGRRERITTAPTRLQLHSVYQTVIFLLESVVFSLIGLQLPTLIRDLSHGE